LQYYDFENNIGYIINRTAKAFVGALDSQLREKVGVTASQWKVLQWHKMMECVLNIKEISLKGIPDESVKIMKDALENIWCNLRLYFDVDSDYVKKSHHKTLVSHRED